MSEQPVADNAYESMELAIRQDLGGRGLLTDDNRHWRQGDLERAAQSLATRIGTVGIVTGFAIPMPEGAAAETDGPPGAALLAEVLTRLGHRALLITDEICQSAVEASARLAGLPDGSVLAMPMDRTMADNWCLTLLSEHPLTHLITIERVGPSHTLDSILWQPRPGTIDSSIFAERVPLEHRDRCHNMRGEVIDDFTAPLHRLFELAEDLAHPPIMIGVGDGGNELGLGAIPWEDIAARLKGPQADWLPCRIATDYLVLAGVSNWGGQALAAGAALAAGQPELALAWTAERQQAFVEQLVTEGPCVDGARRTAEATVDGLEFEAYLQPWRTIESILSNG